jgi:hypothetical protein
VSDKQRIHDTSTTTKLSLSSHTQSAKKKTAALVTVILPTLIRRMATTAAKPSVVPPKDLESFQQHLAESTRILALLGAGLSASSGLPTFRGAGGLWRTHDATSLATPGAFERDPGLVWQFYSYRRHMALQAKPNPAHYALAELARKKDAFITLSQNVDGKHRTPTPSIVMACIANATTNQAYRPAHSTQLRSSSYYTVPSSTSSAQISSAIMSRRITTRIPLSPLSLYPPPTKTAPLLPSTPLLHPPAN